MKKISDKRLKKLGGKLPFSTISKKPKPLRKSNPRRKAKRTALYRKTLAGKEYKAARAEAMARAADRCEQETPVHVTWGGNGIISGGYTERQRCLETLNLHAHHLRYPKSRRLEARDLLIVCKFHHEYLESLKPHKTRMF
jgi:hypothetical protein